MQVQIEIIEMPNVDEVRAVSAIRRQELAQQESARIDEMERKAAQDLPRLIRFINQQIEEAKMNGLSDIEFSFNDEEWKIKDPRCIFTCKGRFDPSHAEFLNNLYKELGFKGWVNYYSYVNRLCYRSGSVHLFW